MPDDSRLPAHLLQDPPRLAHWLTVCQLRDELQANLAGGTLDDVGRQSAEYHLRLAEQTIEHLETAG